MNKYAFDHQRGFTLLELLVVIGIIGVLFGMATISLLQTQHRASVSSAVDQLISDLHTQQTKAMIGTKDTTGNANSYGVHISASSYVLFQGTTDPQDATDFTVSPESIVLSTTAPSSSIDFAHGSGEIGGGPYTITVKNAYGTQQKVITIDRYGVVTSVQ